MDEYEQAWSEYHEEFLRRKYTMLSKLETIKEDIHTSKVYKQWLEQVMEFIKEQKG